LAASCSADSSVGACPEWREAASSFGRFVVRLVRFGDGFQQRYYAQSFNLYSDLKLAPELVRFARSTLRWW
jgi:hypothetical protein